MNTLNGAPLLSPRSKEVYDLLEQKFKGLGTVKQRLPIIMDDEETLGNFLASNNDIKVSDLDVLLAELGNPEGKLITSNISGIIGALVSHSGVDILTEQRTTRRIIAFLQK